MFEFLSTPTAQMVISIAILIWGIVWTLLAMWKSAVKKHWIWFILIFAVWFVGNLSIVLAIIGSFGLLAILYFFVLSRFKIEDNKVLFEKWGKKNKKEQKKK